MIVILWKLYICCLIFSVANWVFLTFFCYHYLNIFLDISWSLTVTCEEKIEKGIDLSCSCVDMFFISVLILMIQFWGWILITKILNVLDKKLESTFWTWIIIKLLQCFFRNLNGSCHCFLSSPLHPTGIRGQIFRSLLFLDVFLFLCSQSITIVLSFVVLHLVRERFFLSLGLQFDIWFILMICISL